MTNFFSRQELIRILRLLVVMLFRLIAADNDTLEVDIKAELDKLLKKEDKKVRQHIQVT